MQIWFIFCDCSSCSIRWALSFLFSVFLTSNWYFHSYTSGTTCASADASQRVELCGHKLRDRDTPSKYSKVVWPCNANRDQYKGIYIQASTSDCLQENMTRRVRNETRRETKLTDVGRKDKMDRYWKERGKQERMGGGKRYPSKIKMESNKKARRKMKTAEQPATTIDPRTTALPTWVRTSWN